MRPEQLETRHSELSMHITFEENGARKSIQTTAQKSSQKLKKDEKCSRGAD